MRSWFLAACLLAASACDDAMDDDDDGAAGISGGLDISVTGSAVSCTATYAFSGAESDGEWCPDCSYAWDTYFTLTTQTGDCGFTDIDSAIGYYPSYDGGVDAVVYEYLGDYYYFGVASIAGSQVSWGYSYYEFSGYGAGYYDYVRTGDGTMN